MAINVVNIVVLYPDNFIDLAKNLKVYKVLLLLFGYGPSNGIIILHKVLFSKPSLKRCANLYGLIAITIFPYSI